jgi:hypothetical protein
MSNLFWLEPSWFGTGLTNEIFFIIYGIIDCINNNKQNFIINRFRLEPLTEKFCDISEIIDIHHLNILLNKYDVTVFDKNTLSFNIDSIIYGINENTIDITKEITELFYKNNKLLIPIGTNLNNIKGDPVSGQLKNLYINYTLNSKKVTEKYIEYINTDIVIDLQTPRTVLNWEQIDNCYINNKTIFDYLLKNIRFNNRLVKYSEIALLIDRNNEYTNIANINFENKKTNVIHLRIEKDMTGHMLGHNNMTQEEYDTELQNKYIDLIKNNFSKNDIIFVLTYDLDNNVIKFLKENDYEFYYTKKNIFNGREKHAIIDLLIGEKCNNNFIGNWNFDIRQGSTFSYFLYTRNDAIKNIFIDMYDIKKEEKSVNKNHISEDNFLSRKNYEYIVKKYKNLGILFSDINEHLPTLYKYAKECNTILECGVRGCVSSWAFVHGLIDNKNDIPKKLILNDIAVCDIDDLLYHTKHINNLQVEYKWCSDLDLIIDENVDLVFIDTLHVYGQLKRELEKFSKISNKYIIMHDTTVDEIYGECIRLNWDIESMAKITNFSADELTKGLKPALDEFLLDNDEWVIHEIFINNNGLTVLKKTEN